MPAQNKTTTRRTERIVGLHWKTGTPIEIACHNGRITNVRRIVSRGVGDLPWIAPTLVDLQVNGYAGVDFQSETLSGEDLRRAATGLSKDGCNRFLLTLITAPWKQLCERLKRLKTLRDADPVLRRSIAGWHIEGPFLSAEPGYSGAHNPDWMLDPTPAAMGELRRIVGLDRLLVTLAPERKGAIATIRRARQLGIVVSFGHTNATSERIAAAVKAGAIGFTHLGNGCPQQWDRHDNIIWRVLNQPGLHIGLIPDGIHVSPDFFRLLHHIVPSERLWYVTDAMSAAGMGPGTYDLAGMRLRVGRDGVVRRPGSNLFAGSSLRSLELIRQSAQMLHQPWQECWTRYSVQPGGLVGLRAGLRAGDPADFITLEESKASGLPLILKSH